MDIFKKRKQISEDELQKKISDLPSDLQAQFLWATDLLLQRESTLFLDIIQDSRNEINDIGHEIKVDTTIFRANVSKLDKYDDGQINSANTANNKLNEFVEKRQKQKKNIILNYQPDHEKEAVENYLKAVGRHKDNDSKSDIPSYARPATSDSNKIRPGTAFKIKLDDNKSSDYIDSSRVEYLEPITINVDPTLNKQQEELIHKLKEQDTQAITEKERQKKLMEKKKAERQNKRIDSAGVRAAGMIDQSKGVDEKQLQNKLQQEKTIHERLEKMKVNKNSSPDKERYDENRKNLSSRPQTGDSNNHEFIELRTPAKSGWEEQSHNKNVASMFEVNEQFSNEINSEKKHKKKKHRKTKDETIIENNNDVEIITFDD